MPTGKIGVYTRFFEYANFRLPLSTFLVNVLRHYRIHISQLSVIGAAKVSHFEILCRVHGFEPTVGLFRCFYVNSKNKGWMSFSKRQGNDAVCYTKPLDSLKSWNDHFFWVDAFACPASFPWNTSKSVSKDPFPKSSEFNAEHYATLVAYPAPFHKYPEPFLCLIGISQIDLLSIIQTADPIKVRVGERQRAEDEPKLLFDEGGSGNLAEQGDSTSGGHGVGIPLVSEAAETVVEDVAPVQPRRQRKRKTVVPDAGGPSHPPKKLREDHGTLSVTSVGGKSRSAVQRLLAGAVQNAEVRGEPIPTLPFVTSSVSATPEREDEVHTDSATGLNLRTIGAPQRFVISSDSSHHSGANIAEAEVDSFARPSVPLMTVATTVTSTVDPATTVKEKFVESSVFGGDSSGGGADHTVGGFSDLTGSDFIVGGIRTVISPDTDLQKVYVPQWSVTNGSRLDDGRTCREMVDEFAPPKLFAQFACEEAESCGSHLSLYEALCSNMVEKYLRDEVNVLKEQNAALEQESTNFGVKVADLTASVKVREQEVADLDAQVAFAKSWSDNLAGRLYVDFVEMVLHLEEKFYPHLLTTIAGRRWLLTYGVKLDIVKCLHSPEYLSALGAAISKAIEKGMQDGLAAGITHELQDVNFSLLAELKSNKDASTETLMNILRLDEPLAERLGLDESQPHVDQLLVPIHHSPNQTVIGATSLLFSLDVSRNRVQKIRDNIANHRSALRDVFVPLVEPLSSAVLEGMEGTFGTAPETTTALSVTFASTSSIPPISTDDYDVVHADGQEGTGADGQTGAGADVNPFPNVEDAELDIS
ncbi:hypothetical protein Tco_0943873 [Tanacetum coccineum]